MHKMVMRFSACLRAMCVLGAGCGEALNSPSPDAATDASHLADASLDSGVDAESPAGPAILVSDVSGVAVEGGAAAMVTVRLATEPSGAVAVPIAIAGGQASTTPSSVVFDSTNWQTAQSVQVLAVDDALIDGSTQATVSFGPAISGDLAYAGLSGPARTVVVQDDDVVGVVVASTVGSLCDVSGSATTLNLRLRSQPTANVTVPVSTSMTSAYDLSTTTVTFTPGDWNQDHPVVVTYDGAGIAGDTNVNLVFGTITSTDPWYGASSFGPLPFAVCDVGAARVIVNAVGGGALSTPLHVDETGHAVSMAVTLAVAPTSPVTLSLEVSDTTEATVAPGTLVFDATNWNVPQVATVTGTNDGVPDGAVSLQLRLDPSSADVRYDGQPTRSFALVNHSAPTNVADGRPIVVSQCGESPFSGAVCMCSGLSSCLMVDSDATPPRFTMDLGANYLIRSILTSCSGGGGSALLELASDVDQPFEPVTYVVNEPVTIANQVRLVRVTATSDGTGPYTLGGCVTLAVHAWTD